MSRFAPLFCGFVLATAGCGGTSSDSDAGADGRSATDTNSDSPACHANTDCDDGIYCNGAEACTAGACVAGMAPACSDGIACTRDFCSEDRHACVNQVPDADHDGHGAASCLDSHGIALGDDCNDMDGMDFPGNAEVCDAMHHDEDCNAHTHGHVDADSDGFEDAQCCNGTDCGNDCDDGNRSVNPMATEVCNLVDDDCDTMVDEGTGVMLYADGDRDGWGTGTMQTMHCSDAVGFSARTGDCDDTKVAVHPGQPEICDMLDNDCDFVVDEQASAVNWYLDHDGDGYGDASATPMSSCTPLVGYSLLASDCDDSTASRSPAAPEVCNAIDDDCNGRADFSIASGDLEDDDGDHSPDIHCGAPRGADCNDRDPTALPGAPEICNGRDDNCNGMIDEGATQATFHADMDHDGYGDPGTAIIACLAPSAYVLDASDCDDHSAMRHPGAMETCNASDDDCDGTIDETPAESSCSITNGVAACTVGICHLASCAPGWSDCTLAPGCETSTVADNLRCGGCNTACDPMFGQCAHSTCEPGGSSGIAAVSGGDDVGTSVAASGSQGGTVVAGQFAGTGFGVGCQSAFDAHGVAGFVSLRRGDASCQYVIAIDGTGDEIVTAVASDSMGNVWVALTTTSATLAIGSMNVNAGTGQGGRDAVIAELDPMLHPLWAQRFGGMNDDAIAEIVLDGTDLYAVGSMRGPVTLGTMMLATSASADPVLLHLGAADGSVMGAATATTSGTDGALGVYVDAMNVYVAGVVVGSGRFGSRGTDPMLTAMGPSDGFVWMLDRATMNTTFARALGGTGTDIARAVATNQQVTGLSLLVTGSFESTVMIDATRSITAAGRTDGFAIGVDPTGMLLWGSSFGGPGDDSLNDIGMVFGSWAVVGTFEGMPMSNGSDAGVQSAGGSDGLLIQVDPNGSISFATPIGGAGDEQALRIAIVGGMQVWIAGSYTSHFNWQFGSNFVSVGGTDAMFVETYPPGA